MHQSIATIDSPEFINLERLDINPLMSKCEIKVLYVGENRNGSFISKEVAENMAKTLRGAPIVGYYKEEKEDFADHGERIIMDDEGISFECMTRPYGFVSPDAKVWFQFFEESDDFGNTFKREYLMTTGYLWTGQYQECQSVIDEGKAQSMELDENTLDGYWATNPKTNMDFFIINDAIFSKLCILGDDVEPCFEGANITAPEVSTSFSKKMDDNFKQTLFAMMQELKNALNSNEQAGEATTEEQEVQSQGESEPEVPEQQFSDNSVAKEQYDELENKFNTLQADFAKKEEELQDWVNKYNEISTQLNELVVFKEQVINEKKDNLINSFTLLTEEEKEDVVTKKSEYSLEEINDKLTTILAQKVGNTAAPKEQLSYQLTEEDIASVPAWVTAVKNNKNNK